MEISANFNTNLCQFIYKTAFLITIIQVPKIHTSYVSVLIEIIKTNIKIFV